MASGYNPALHEAPIVVGHPTTDAPAYGWVARFVADEAGLHAAPAQLDPAFAEAVRAGRYKKVSISLYRPGAPNNPTPGHWYPKHVGFLGGAAPAVKGLRCVALADDDQALRVSLDLADSATVSPFVFGRIADALRSVREWMIQRDDLDTANSLLPDHTIEAIRSEAARLQQTATSGPEPTDMSDPSMSTQTPTQTELTAREAALKTREEALNAQLAAAEQQAAATEQQAAAEYAEQLVAAGKILPRHATTVVDLLAALPRDSVVSYSEDAPGPASQIPARQVLQKIFDELAPSVDYSERTPRDTSAAAQSIAVPAGYQVDPTQAALHARVVAYAEKTGKPYDEALTIISATISTTLSTPGVAP